MRPSNAKVQNHNENADRHLIACALRWRPFYTPGDLTVTTRGHETQRFVEKEAFEDGNR